MSDNSIAGYQQLVIEVEIYKDEIEEYYLKEWDEITEEEKQEFFDDRLSSMEHASMWLGQMRGTGNCTASILDPKKKILKKSKASADPEDFDY